MDEADMRAITINQPWASLIIVGAKPFEWRSWPAPKALVGQRIVIHASVSKRMSGEHVDHLRQIKDDKEPTINMELAEPILQSMADLPYGVGIGTIILGKPAPVHEIYMPWISSGDVDPDDLNCRMWGWPMSDPRPFARLILARGQQGFWRWPYAGRE